MQSVKLLKDLLHHVVLDCLEKRDASLQVHHQEKGIRLTAVYFLCVYNFLDAPAPLLQHPFITHDISPGFECKFLLSDSLRVLLPSPAGRQLRDGTALRLI
jgi:hypothetical protein